jgi:ribose transport system substrate-binding protein
MRHHGRRRLLSASLLAVIAVAGVGCGSSSGTTGTSSTGAPSTAAGADVTAAKKMIEPYIGQPSAFPVDEPLPKPLPAGTRIGYLQCSTPACAIFGAALAGAAKTIGAQLDVVKTGPSAEDLQAGMTSLLEKRPDGLVIPGIEPSSIAGQLEAAKKQGIPMVSNGISGAEKYGIGGQTLGSSASTLSGKLLAAWAIAQKGDDADVVFYNVPELSFSAQLKEGFADEMKRLCPDCPVRYVDLPVASIGTTAPTQVVSDLQAHPSSNVAAFGSSSASTGLPAALKTAGLAIDVIGFSPAPANLQDIKDGKLASGLGVDLGTLTWTLMDELARLITDEPLTAGEESTLPPLQILTAKDLEGQDVSAGWSGYADFPDRFAKLWKGD